MLYEIELYRRIYSNLLLLRTYYGYTQERLASVLSCARSTYSYIEQGKSHLSLYSFYLLCELYHLPPEAMWSDLQSQNTYHLRNRPEVLEVKENH